MSKVAALGRSRASSFASEAASTPETACPCFFYNPSALSFHSSHHDCHFGSGVTVMADLEYLTSAYSSTGHAKPQANIMADRFV